MRILSSLMRILFPSFPSLPLFLSFAGRLAARAKDSGDNILKNSVSLTQRACFRRNPLSRHNVRPEKERRAFFRQKTERANSFRPR